MDKTLTSYENRSATLLALIMAFRMLGLFMIVPVFPLYMHQIPGATAFTIGFAIGIYGLMQAILQIPFGMLSDKIGRKPVIIMGLILFIAGSLLAAVSQQMTGIIFGRLLQGAGAIGSTTVALLADLTSVEHRTKAMAIFGITIGLSFVVALVLGPLINAWLGLSGIFWFTAVLGLLAIMIVLIAVPQPKKLVFHRDAEPIPALFLNLLKNNQLLRLDFGIFTLHAIFSASFLAIPIILEKKVGLPAAHQWYLYLPVLILAFINMLPLIFLAEAKRQMKPVFIFCIMLLAVVELVFGWAEHSLFSMAALLLVFFAAFTTLEASLPSLISKIAPSETKGTAMGIYSSSQFLGIFVGGSLGGLIFSHFSLNAVFMFCLALAVIWLIIAARMPKPPAFASYLLNIGQINAAEAKQLSQTLKTVPGVMEAMVSIEDGIAYLKVDNKIVDQAALKKFSMAE